jgi:hypothetical protein
MLSVGNKDGKQQFREEKKYNNDTKLKNEGVKVRAMEEIARFFEN